MEEKLNNENKKNEKKKGIFRSIGDALKELFANSDKKDSNEKRRKIEMQVDQIEEQQDNGFISEWMDRLKPSSEKNENQSEKAGKISQYKKNYESVNRSKGKKGTRREIYQQVEEVQRKREQNNGNEIGED